MIVGFTGTRKGMSEKQVEQCGFWLLALRELSLSSYDLFQSNAFHFGGSGKSDLKARELAKALGYEIHWHPIPGIALGDLPSALFEEAKDEVWHEVFPPLVRDRYIVDASAVLIAAPETDDEELRSGTWATTRYMQALEKPVLHLSRGARRKSAATLPSRSRRSS